MWIASPPKSALFLIVPLHSFTSLYITKFVNVPTVPQRSKKKPKEKAPSSH